MDFYCINFRPTNRVAALLRDSCEKRDIRFHEVTQASFDPTDVPNISGAMLYRVTVSRSGCAMELSLMEKSKNIATVYKNPEAAFRNVLREIMIFDRANIAQPKTVPFVPSDRDMLARSAESLGGFPVILKVLGRYKGTGVLRVDSMSALFSLADYLDHVDHESVAVMRSYIPHDEQARLTVVGDRVVASKCNIRHGDEFRLNVGKDRVEEVKDYPETINQLAIAAVHALGFDFGAVDILIHRETGKLYVSEVNMPCNFAPAQEITGVDIAGAVVDMMREKIIQSSL